MTDQEPDRGKRKRPYRQRVICGECKKELDSDYKDNHAKTVHKGKKVAFAMVRERNQSQLAFFTKSSTESQLSHKLSRSDIQNDVHYQEDIRNESTGTILMAIIPQNQPLVHRSPTILLEMGRSQFL